MAERTPLITGETHVRVVGLSLEREVWRGRLCVVEAVVTSSEAESLALRLNLTVNGQADVEIAGRPLMRVEVLPPRITAMVLTLAGPVISTGLDDGTPLDERHANAFTLGVDAAAAAATARGSWPVMPISVISVDGDLVPFGVRARDIALTTRIVNAICRDIRTSAPAA